MQLTNYWPNIDEQIYAVHVLRVVNTERAPSKPELHPWVMPEKPWSCVHIDHAITFMGHNWLVIMDAYTKYPCIHPAGSVSTKSTIELLEEDFAHFGYPHAIVSDNATSFTSEEFQNYCKQRDIVHLTGAPYHPPTNGAAERLIQTFKQALRKSSESPKPALVEFLMHYRRTPTSSGYFPSELLNSRRMRTIVDTLLPSPLHMAQSKMKKLATSYGSVKVKEA